MIVAHLVPAFVVAMSLSELGSMLINNGVGARDKRRREDNFSCKDPAIFCILDGLLLDMIVKESKLDCEKRTLERADSGCGSACERVS